ncbi:MAG: OadG family protein [Lachnospiraceae bacterium]|nr:OadG family protein [Lachnospiraceae bacterium]
MKMKKIVLLFSMIAVLFSLTGCSDGQEHVNFEYTSTNIVGDTLYQSYQFQNASDSYRAYLEDSEEELAKALLGGVNNFETATEECGNFVGYRLKDGDSKEFDFAALQAQDEAVYYAAVEDLNTLVANVDASIEESGNTVIVKVTAAHEYRDVIYTYIYEKNPAYDYAQEIYQQSVAPYQIKEVTAAPNYSFGEKMSKAGMNTLMGMGTVFIVLIFISFIIAQFEKINKASIAASDWWANRKNKDNAVKTTDTETKAVVSAPVSTVANPMDDSQLVAVITAAVVAASTASGGTDKLIVRSIRKAKR